MTWGRDESAGQWISSSPYASICAGLVGLTVAAGGAAYHVARWTPTQRHSLGAYARSTMMAGLDLGPQTYTLPTTGRKAKYQNEDVRAYLSANVYDGRTISRLFAWPAGTGAGVFALLLCFTVPMDRKRKRERRLGRRLKGTEIVENAADFSARVKGDGFSIRQTSGPAIWLPRNIETSHTLIVGGTGTGKSTLIAERLDQIRARGERAVVYDPAGQFVTTHWREGDTVLHPWDARTPYWKIGDEVTSDLEARAAAASLIPHKPNEFNSFFPDSARTVLAALLKRRPTAQQLVEWLVDADEIINVLKGTPDEKKIRNFLDGSAPQQRGGVMGSLNLIVDTLELCPTQSEAKGGRWSAADWADRGTGWVFITSTPGTRETLIPLQTLWLDSLILRLMERVGGTKTHLMLDEVDTLNTIGQLKTALTEGRKYNLALVLGFQSFAQLDARYGRQAETMLSQPAAQLFLRSSGKQGSEWASKTLGEVETEHMKQSRQDGWARSKTTSFGLERRVEPMAMPSEISGLANLTGYLKIGGLVTTLEFPYVERPAINPAFIMRPQKPRTVQPSKPAPFEFDVLESTHAITQTQRME